MKNISQLTDVIFDIDGTLIDSGNPLSPPIIHGIEKILQKNVNVTFATARPLRDTLPLLPQNFQEFSIIGCNGGMHSKHGKVQRTKNLSASTVDILKTTLDSFQIPYIIDGLYNYAISKTSCKFHRYMEHKLGNKPRSYTEVKNEGVTKLLILNWNPTMETILQKLIVDHQLDLTLNHHTKENFLDIAPAQTNKFYAAVENGINFSSTAVFGNDHNDLLLLRNAHLPFVVGNNLIDHIDFSHTAIKHVDDVPEELARLVSYL